MSAETHKFTHLISQVQQETTAELVGVRRQIQTVTSESESRIEQNASQTSTNIDELTSRVIEHRSEVEVQVNKLDDRADELGSELSKVKESISEISEVIQRKQRESIELVNQQANKEKSATDSRIETLSSEIVALKSRVAGWNGVNRSENSVQISETSNTVQFSPEAVGVNNCNNANISSLFLPEGILQYVYERGSEW
jgi:chromosome segregation ATPase